MSSQPWVPIQVPMRSASGPSSAAVPAAPRPRRVSPIEVEPGAVSSSMGKDPSSLFRPWRAASSSARAYCARPKRTRPARRALPRARPLFVCGQLRGRAGLEPLVRNRLPALDREPVGAGRQPLLRALDGGELVAQILLASFGELVLVEVGGPVRRVELVRLLAV